jgi:hypothetical protein
MIAPDRLSSGVRWVGRSLVTLAGTAQALRRAAGREAEHPPGLRRPGKEADRPKEAALEMLSCTAWLLASPPPHESDMDSPARRAQAISLQA